MPPKKRRNLRGQVGVQDLDKREGAKKPHCVMHKITMEFDTDRLLWKCTKDGCRIVAHPKDEAGGNSPTKVEGPFVLFVNYDEDSMAHLMMKSADNYFIDLSDHVTDFDRHEMSVTLKFYTAFRADKEGNILSL